MSLLINQRLCLLCMVCATMWACSSDPDSPTTDAECRINSDCGQGERCDNGVCVEGEDCTGDNCPCASDAECASGLLCDTDTGQCFTPECEDDADCDLNEACVRGVCVTDVDADADRDGVPDNEDLCPEVANPEQEDNDEDGQGDVCDEDDDNDGIDDEQDNCPLISNADQADLNDNGTGDACEGDGDNDGVPDDDDNCPEDSNPDQRNSDGDDEGGDECDDDDDNDGVLDVDDNCQFSSNPDQEDADSNGQGDACDGDRDGDGAPDESDNCPDVPNEDQLNTDGANDGGDACDDDDDNDSVTDEQDNCPLISNEDQFNTDGANDGGDVCDEDDDNDSVTDGQDNCPLIANEDQRNSDGDEDGGDECDEDDDNDGVLDAIPDNCPLIANADQQNADGDGLGDACDPDADDDGLANGLDNCPLTHNPMQEDLEGLGRGVTCALGTSELPFDVGCGVTQQHLNTQGRTDTVQGTCGGDGVGEVVYQLSINPGETWSVEVEAQHGVVLYLLDEDGDEVACVSGRRAEFSGDELEGGQYLLSVDGAEESDKGPLKVSIRASEACAPRFLASETQDVGSAPAAVRVGDLDADGLADIVVANAGSDNITVLNRRPTGRLRRQGYSVDGDSPEALALGDVNGDGWLDVVTANNRSDNISLFLTNGANGNATLFRRDPPEPFHTGDGPIDVALADVNGDGHLDALTANETSDDISVLLGDGDGGFAPAQPFEVGDRPQSLALGDVNADGLLDVVTANRNDNTFSVMLGDGEGGFSLHASITTPPDPVHVALGDLNQDGHLDLVASLLAENDVGVYHGDGTGEFVEAESAANNFFMDVTLLGDINNDGLLDIVKAGFSDHATVYLGNPSGDLDDPIEVALGETVGRSASLADVNGDGRLDMITTSNFIDPEVSDTVTVWYGAVDGAFMHQTTLADGGGTYGASTGDFNGDGHPDIVTANKSTDDASVFLADGQGGFVPASRVDVGSDPVSVGVGDVNGDGHLDAVVANKGAANADGNDDELTVLLGQGDGRLTTHTTLEVGDGPVEVALGDLTGNGRLDLAVVSTLSDEVSIFQGAGNGDFSVSQVLEVSESPIGIELGDVTGDGRLDIVTASSRSRDGNADVLLNNGNGTFTRSSPITTNNTPAVLLLEDANGDGDLDLIVSSDPLNDPVMLVLLGDGDGGFEEHSSMDPRQPPGAMAFGDVNGDGHGDIVTAHKTSNRIHILAGTGDGHFAFQSALGVGGQHRSLVLSDLDGDGLVDILTANISSASLSVMTARKAQRAAHRIATSNLPPCAPTTTQGLPSANAALAFLNSPPEPCRVERFTLELPPVPPEARGNISVTPPSLHSVVLLGLPSESPLSDVWHPEGLAPLARFEDHPLEGLWTLQAPVEVDSAQMVINTYPDDPFHPDTLADPCTSNRDQSANPDLACRLDGDTLDGVVLEDNDDEDVFLLEGDLDGAFLEGQTITATLTTTPGRNLSVGLRALRAARALALAEEVEPGTWEVSFTVPSDYSGRYFAIHVQGQGIDDLEYDLRIP